MRVSKEGVFGTGALTRPLYITRGSTAWAFVHEDDRNVPSKRHDIVVTPIPPRLWPTVAHLRIFLSNRAGSLAAVADFLERRNINVLLAQSIRASRTFAIWNLVVEFEDFREDASNLDIESEAAWRWMQKEGPAAVQTAWQALMRKVVNRVDDLVGKPPDVVGEQGTGELRERFPPEEGSPLCREASLHSGFKEWVGDDLISEMTYPRKMVEGYHLNALKYFHYRIVRRILGKETRDRIQPFAVTCPRDGDLVPSERGAVVFGELTAASPRAMDGGQEQPAKPKAMLPTYAAAHLDTEEMYLRLALIPPGDAARFRRVELWYRTAELGRRESTKGTLASIAQQLYKEDYDIWRTVNQTSRMKSPERGRVIITAEYVGFGDPVTHVVESAIQRAIGRDGAGDRIQLDRPLEIRPLAPCRIFVSMKQDFLGREIYLRIIRDEAERLGIRYDDVVHPELPDGFVLQEVLKTMRDADAVLVITHPGPKEAGGAYDWLVAETAVATFSDKPLILVGDGSISRVFQGIAHKKLSVQANEATVRTVVHDAVSDLIQRVMSVRGHTG